MHNNNMSTCMNSWWSVYDKDEMLVDCSVYMYVRQRLSCGSRVLALVHGVEIAF